jgi:hypothetical protein
VFAGLASALIRTAEAEIARRQVAPVIQEIQAPLFRTYSPEPDPA